MWAQPDTRKQDALVCPRCRRAGEGRRCPTDGAFLVTRGALSRAGRDAWLGEIVADRYAILERLGMGGMGTVYRARDEKTGENVAIKFLREQYATHPSIRMRFIREAEAGAAVDSPYVVPVLDFGIEADRTLWIVMGYVKGHTLRDEVNRNGPFNSRDIVTVARHVLLGLVAAHDAGLVHRDLKHDNVMFSGSRDEFTARILDFGVVKSAVVDEELAKTRGGPLTAAGVMVGSPSYMSPEQIRGLDVGPPADLYALAVVMYEAVTARRLFSVNNYEGLLRSGARRDAPPLTHNGSGDPIPEALDRIVQRALAHDPDARYPDARTMMLALDQMELELEAPPADLYADVPTRAAPLDLSDPPVVERPVTDGLDLADPPTPTPAPGDGDQLTAEPSMPELLPPASTHAEMVGHRPWAGPVALAASAAAVVLIVQMLG